MDFVTGGTGIVGRELLAQLLSKGGSVKALRRDGSDVESVESFIHAQGLSTDKLEWVYGDTRDYDKLESALHGCDKVFHLAALVSFHPSDEHHLMGVNKAGTENVVNAMLIKGIKKLVYVSSVSALGHSTKSLITEETPFEEGPLVTGYSRSKYASELEVWRGQAEGLDVLIVNPTIIIGEGDFLRSSGELFSQTAKCLPVYSAGSNGFVSARDVASACLALEDIGAWGQRFLLNGANLSYKDAMTKIAKSVNAAPPTKVVKGRMINFAAFVFKFLEIVTGRKSLANKTIMLMAQLDTKYDGSKILKTLDNWYYEDIDTAIERTGKAYLRSL